MSGESGTVRSERVTFVRTDLLPTVTLWGLFVAVILLAVALIDSVMAAGLEFSGAPTSIDSLGFAAASFAAGVVTFLLVQRYDLGRRVLQVGFGVYLTWLAGEFLALWFGLPLPVALAAGAVVPGVLFAYPEWYVMNLVAMLWGATLATIIGVSFVPRLVLVALVAWAVYDAYAVYRSDVMEDLASAGMDMSLPGAFYVPTAAGATLRDTTLFEDEPGDDTTTADADGGETGDGGDGADFRLLGVLDALVPGALVVSATQFLEADPVVWSLNAPALGALVGGLVGLVVLEALVRRIEGIHAGLPVLNAATIGGYLVGALVAGVGVAQALGL